LISTAYQYELQSIHPIYEFFQKIFSNVYESGLIPWISNHPFHFNIDDISKFYFNNPDTFQFMKNILSQCDLGIHEIKMESTTDEEGVQKYYPIFGHQVEGKMFFLPYGNQSSGTKSLYLQLGIYDLALTIGGVLILDEFDINLHPDILPILIKLFEDEKQNQKMHNSFLLRITQISWIL
jgi:uncharacterized protein